MAVKMLGRSDTNNAAASDLDALLVLATNGDANATEALDSYPQTGGRTVASLSAYLANNAVFNVKDFGAVGDGVTDDTAAIEAAIADAVLAVSGATGAVVIFPQGTYSTASQITLPNRVALRGANGRGTIIKAAAGHTGPWMFNAVNGVSSMFGSKLTDLSIDCNSVAGLGGVLADAWQETSGLERVVIQNFRTSAVKLQNGYGGASHCLFTDIEFFGSASGATYGIDLQQISLVGGFMLAIRGATIAGDAAAPLTAGINVVQDSVLLNSVHFENATVGILLDGIGNSHLVGLAGAATVTDVVKIAAAFTGTVQGFALAPRGATNTLNNAVTAQLVTGAIASLLYGNVLLGKNTTVFPTTPDTDDDGSIIFGGGGTNSSSRGAWVALYGNEHATAGRLRLVAGSAGYIETDGRFQPLNAGAGDFGAEATKYNGIYLDGGVEVGIVTKTAAYPLTANDHTVLGDATAGAFDLTLPAAASHVGRVYVCKKIDASVNAVTVEGNAAETIDGAANVALAAQWDFVAVQSNGTSWFTIASS